MWLKIRQLVQRLFGKKVQQPDEEVIRSGLDAQRYADITKENITALVANNIATLAFGDSTVGVSLNGQTSKRTALLDEIAQKEWANAKRNVACGLGIGMIASIPYSVDNGLGRKIYVDTISKDRFFIVGMQGSDITQCVAISDMVMKDSQAFLRWTEYSIENSEGEGHDYVIRQKVTCEGVEFPLTSVPKWEHIEPEIRIRNVDRLPIGIFRCPASNRRPSDINGVPITYGCDATLHKIAKTFEDIEKEFDYKKIKVFADRALIRQQYDENGNLVNSGIDDDLFVKFGSSDTFDMDIFDPSFRESSYYAKLQQHFAFLEKEIGVSRGVLTDLSTNGATATEIRRAMFQTFCFVDDVHENYSKYFEDLIYGCNVLANLYELTPIGDYNVSFDWSYALLEDSKETFDQKTRAVSLGAERVEEVRIFLHPEETLEEAAAVVAEIKKNNPTVDQLINEE